MTAAPDYLRTARSPRMLGMLALLLAVAAVCARLGMWQLERAQEGGAPPELEPVPLTEVLEPGSTFRGELVGRAVTVRGQYADGEVLVPGRAVAGEVGYLVVTPLAVAETGALLPVVRGWVAEPGDAAASPPPTGTVEVAGRLQAGEAGRGTAPEGQVSGISPAELVNQWDGQLYTGYLVAEQPGALVAVPQPEAPRGLDVQNVAYALQWWIFGGFAVAVWLRMVRDDARAAGSVDGPQRSLTRPTEEGVGAAP